MEWTDDAVIHFVQLYRNKDILWDSKHPLYKVSNKKHEAWTEIAAEMAVDVAELKKKINSLLATYRKIRRKVSEQTSGMSVEQYVPWFAYESFAFLHERYKPRKTTDTHQVSA